jgi:signal transduction histidine kinase
MNDQNPGDAGRASQGDADPHSTAATLARLDKELAAAREQLEHTTNELNRCRRRLLRCRVDLETARQVGAAARGNGAGAPAAPLPEGTPDVPARAERAAEDLRRQRDVMLARISRRTADLSLLRDIAVAANVSGSVDEMLSYTLRRAGEHFRWPFGVAFRSTWGLPSALGLTPPVLFAAEPQRFERMGRLVRAEPEPLAGRLPGRAFDEARPLWSDDLPGNLPASIAAEAGTLGLKMLYVFPLMAGPEPVGILKFYGPRAVQPGRSVLETMAGVCTQLGHVLQRDDLSRQLLELTAYEQGRVSRDLHEAVGQELAGLAMTVESMTRRRATEGVPPDALERVAEGLRQALVDIQGVARGLAPVPAGPGGLGMMLEQLGRHAEQASPTRMTCQVDADPIIEIADPDVANHLYRIAKEALQNAIVHSHGHRVRIRLSQDDRRINLNVDDDGSGIAESAVRGQGMKSMYQRARLIGGRLEIRGHDGTSVHLSVPRVGVG